MQRQQAVSLSRTSGAILAIKANHHYVPQFYLRSFSAGIRRQAQVFVFDSDTNKAFITQVRNIGSKRHFNRVEAEGVDPNSLEDGMARIETQIANHLQQVIAAKAFPAAEHYNSMMNLIALLSVRNPRLRGVLDGFHKDVAKKIMGLSMSSKEIWDSQTKEMRDDGVPVN